MKFSLTPTMKARIKAFLVSMTATTQRKMIVSGIVTALGALGFTAIAPETVDTIFGLVVTALQTFVLN